MMKRGKGDSGRQEQRELAWWLGGWGCDGDGRGRCRIRRGQAQLSRTNGSAFTRPFCVCKHVAVGAGRGDCPAAGRGQGALLVRTDFVSPKVNRCSEMRFECIRRLGRDSPMGGLAEVGLGGVPGEHGARETWREQKA